MSQPHRSPDESERAERDAVAALEQRTRDAAEPLDRELEARERVQTRALASGAAKKERGARRAFWFSVLGPAGTGIGHVMVMVSAAALAGIAWGIIEGTPSVVEVGLACAAFSAAYFGMAYLVIRRDVRWLRALPFRTRGYQEVLGLDERPTSTVQVDVAFESAASTPDESLCQSIFGKVSTSVTLSGDLVRINSPALPCKSLAGITGGSRYLTNEVHRWLRILLGGMLVPIHGTFRIREVEIRPLP